MWAGSLLPARSPASALAAGVYRDSRRQLSKRMRAGSALSGSAPLAAGLRCSHGGGRVHVTAADERGVLCARYSRCGARSGWRSQRWRCSPPSRGRRRRPARRRGMRAAGSDCRLRAARRSRAAREAGHLGQCLVGQAARADVRRSATPSGPCCWRGPTRRAPDQVRPRLSRLRAAERPSRFQQRRARRRGRKSGSCRSGPPARRSRSGVERRTRALRLVSRWLDTPTPWGGLSADPTDRISGLAGVH